MRSPQLLLYVGIFNLLDMEYSCYSNMQKNMCGTVLPCAEKYSCNSPVMCRRTCVQQPCHVQKDMCVATMSCVEAHISRFSSPPYCSHIIFTSPWRSWAPVQGEGIGRYVPSMAEHSPLLVLSALNSCAPVSAVTHANEQLLCSAVAQWSSQAALWTFTLIPVHLCYLDNNKNHKPKVPQNQNGCDRSQWFFCPLEVHEITIQVIPLF